MRHRVVAFGSVTTLSRTAPPPTLIALGSPLAQERRLPWAYSRPRWFQTGSRCAPSNSSVHVASSHRAVLTGALLTGLVDAEAIALTR